MVRVYFLIVFVTFCLSPSHQQVEPDDLDRTTTASLQSDPAKTTATLAESSPMNQTLAINARRTTQSNKVPHAKVAPSTKVPPGQAASDSEHGTLTPAQQNIVNDMSWPVKVMFYKGVPPTNKEGQKTPTERRVGIEQLVARPRPRATSSSESEESMRSGKSEPLDLVSDDSQIKLKLFTLMDETARDCDLKVQRADLIKAHYTNNSEFEVGMLMGSISDKYRHMTDTAKTLKQFYDPWKPIEHINAYEQIANQAIEVTHLIETARHTLKKLENGKDDAADAPPPERKKRF